MIDGLVSGLVTGSAYAILAVSTVLLYQLTGILNLALAAIGAFGAYLTYLLVGEGAPLLFSFTVGIVSAGLISGATGLAVSKWFKNPNVATKMVLSVALLMAVLALGFRVFGDTPRVMPSLFPGTDFAVAGVRVTGTTVAALLFMVFVAAVLSLVLGFTQTGLRLRAIAEDQATAQLQGINTRAYALAAWFLTGAVAAFALLLVAPTRNPTFETMSFLVVPAVVAAMLGSFKNVWVAGVGGLLIGVLEGAGSRVPALIDYRGALPFLVAIAALLWLRRDAKWESER